MRGPHSKRTAVCRTCGDTFEYGTQPTARNPERWQFPGRAPVYCGPACRTAGKNKSKREAKVARLRAMTPEQKQAYNARRREAPSYTAYGWNARHRARQAARGVLPARYIPGEGATCTRVTGGGGPK